MRRLLLILITAVTLGLGMQPLNATPGATPLFGEGEPSSLVSASELQISVSKGDIIIESATAITGITIYDITGKVLYSAKFAPTSHIRLVAPASLYRPRYYWFKSLLTEVARALPS